MNGYLKDFMGVGGIFHAAIEVYGTEYSYGSSQGRRTGIYCQPPKQCPYHNFRESIYLGPCALSKKQIKAILFSMEPAWRGESYNLFRKNCVDFTRALAIELGLSPTAVPDWVHILAERTAYLEPVLQSLDTMHTSFWNLPLPLLHLSGISPTMASSQRNNAHKFLLASSYSVAQCGGGLTATEQTID
jgi:hypothetical protein